MLYIGDRDEYNKCIENINVFSNNHAMFMILNHIRSRNGQFQRLSEGSQNCSHLKYLKDQSPAADHASERSALRIYLRDERYLYNLT